MSVFNAFRSGGRANKGGYFDFEDEFGQDPIRTRYANTTMTQRDSEARVRLAASEAQLAKASLEAMTEPARQAADFFGNLEKTAKVKDDMMRRSRISARSVQLLEQINSASDWDSLTAIESDPDNAEALQSPEMKARFDARLSAVRTAGIGALKNRLPKTMSTSEVDSLVNDYSWLAGDPEAKKLFETFTPLAQQREAAIKGLQDQGVQAMPTTASGAFDLDRAEQALSGGYTREEVSTDRTILQNLNKQRESILDPDTPEAQQLDEQIKTVTDRLLAAGNQGAVGRARSQAELASLGAGTEFDSEADSLIYGTPKPKPPAPADTTTEPTPVAEPVEAQPKTTPERVIEEAQAVIRSRGVDVLEKTKAEADIAAAQKQIIEDEKTGARRKEAGAREYTQEKNAEEVSKLQNDLNTYYDVFFEAGDFNPATGTPTKIKEGISQENLLEGMRKIKDIRIRLGEKPENIDAELAALFNVSLNLEEDRKPTTPRGGRVRNR